MTNPFANPNPFAAPRSVVIPEARVVTVAPIDTKPTSTAPSWVSVAPIAPAAPLNIPQNIAVDRETGEVFFEDDNETPYDKNNLLLDWRKSAEMLAKAKAREANLRGKVAAAFSDPSKETGTENISLGRGWFVKVEKKLSYTLKSFTEGIDTRGAVERALSALCRAKQDSQGNELNPELGKVVANRIVKWKPELSLTEYKQLLPGHKEIIDTVLEIKPATTSVDLVPPKEKKK